MALGSFYFLMVLELSVSGAFGAWSIAAMGSGACIFRVLIMVRLCTLWAGGHIHVFKHA
jgi:hypothetical protein